MRRAGIEGALVLGLVLGALGIALGFTPGWRFFEAEIGQSWLYRLRGPLATPDEVVVVALDRQSAEELGLPSRLREWPRSVHAALVDRLTEAGATVIVFDVIFERPRVDVAEDEALAGAIRRSGRVVLLEMLESFTRDVAGPGGRAERVTTLRAIRPIPMLSEPALGVAPFPLPSGPGLTRHFWTFVESTRTEPTLPAMALEHHLSAGREQFWGAVEEAGIVTTHQGTGLSERMTALRWSLSSPGETGSMPPAILKAEPAIARRMDLYRGPDARWLNLYGPPGQITTWAAGAVLDDGRTADLARDVRGRAVFIGLVELLNREDDEFQTAFSSDGSLHAGVEIAATAFANLLDGHDFEPLAGPRLGLLLLAFALAVAAVATLSPAILAVPAGLLLGTGHAWIAATAFANGHWLPVAIPLLIQLPVGLLAGLFLQYRAARRTGANLAAGIAYYLPPGMAEALAERPGETAAQTEQVAGVSLVSDVEHFTKRAERQSPAEVSLLLNRYFEAAFAAISNEGGTVTDIVGDGITAFWRGTGPTVRAAACRGARTMLRAIEGLDADPGGGRLPTRIGLNLGEAVLGGVGGSGRFAYSVIGDSVNTAARLEKLNKHLGTRLLASAEVVAGLEGLDRRPLGVFLLYGKEEPIRIVEIVEPLDQGPWRTVFDDALEAFRAGALARAAEGFRDVLRQRRDGPSRFFLDLLEGRAADARRQDDGSVLLLDK